MSHTKIALIAVPAALLLAACSSSGSPAKTPTSPTHAAVPAANTSTSSPAAAATSASAGLSGTWNGTYNGSFSGTFTLNWQQSGSTLSGTINLPDAGGTTDITGSVNGSSIQFGTVGSTDITYTGTVSGSTMSGSYQVKTANGSAGGNWSAARS